MPVGTKQLFVDKLEKGAKIKFKGYLTYLVKQWSNNFPGDIGGKLNLRQIENHSYNDTIFEYAGTRKVTSGYNPKPQVMVVIKYVSGPNPNNISEMLLWPNKTMKYSTYELVTEAPAPPPGIISEITFSRRVDDYEHTGDLDYMIGDYRAISCEHESTDWKDYENRESDSPLVTFTFPATRHAIEKAIRVATEKQIHVEIEAIIKRCDKKNNTNFLEEFKTAIETYYKVL